MLIDWTVRFLLCLGLFFTKNASSLAIDDQQNGELVSKLRQATADDFLLMAMGDTQFWYQCTTSNTACKALTEKLRANYGADMDCEVSRKAGKAHDLDSDGRAAVKQQCREVENNHANDIQSSVVKDLINVLRPARQPRAVIYAGDLTAHGYQEELNAFENAWIKPMNVTLYPGLGNHDIEVNKHCKNYTCVSRMIHWLINFATKNGLKLDYEENNVNGQQRYTGSFAYSTRLCTQSGKQCARVIQLNNLPDYTDSFTSEYSRWKITPSTSFLKKQLEQAKNSNETVFVVSHHLGENSRIIPDAVRSVKMANRVVIVRAHDHEKDEVRSKCGYKTMIPIIYAGSVPKNRFCVVKMSSNGTQIEIFHLAANPDKSATIVHYQNFGFDKCY